MSAATVGPEPGADARALLDALGFEPGERISVSWLDGRGEFVARLVTVDQAPALVAGHAGGDCWIGANPVSDEAAGRGTARDVVALRSLHADLDVKPGGMPTWDAAEAVVADLSGMLGTRPAVVVMSGHGLQPRWLVEHDPETWDNAAARSLHRRWGGLVASAARRRGGEVDNVFDISRVLRAPGTVNRKAEPVRATAEVAEARPLSRREASEAIEAYREQPVAEETVDGLHDPDVPRDNPHEGPIPVGYRNARLWEYAVKMADKYRGDLTEAEVVALVVRRRLDCHDLPTAPTEAEARSMAERAFRNPPPAGGDPMGAASTAMTRGSRLVDGAAFLLDEEETVAALWGSGDEVLWAKGESLMLVGPPGAGKTTVALQVVFARIGLLGTAVAWPVEVSAGKVLYLAMDRPKQIRRAMMRLVRPEHREVLAERLVVHKGPLPVDLTDPTNRDWLADYCQRAGATTVVVDSVKDVVVRLSDDAAAGAYNAARMETLARGVEVAELHHQRKSNGENRKPRALDDVFGSRMLTAGAGSVLMLYGEAGATVVDATHVKPVLEPLAPFKVIHDHRAGLTQRYDHKDVAAMLKAAGPRGLTPAEVARSLHGSTDTSKVEGARKMLKRLVDAGKAEVVPGTGSTLTRYRTAGAGLDFSTEAPDL